MKYYEDEPIIVQCAREILDMYGKSLELERAEEDAKYWRERHTELLNDSIKHGDKMMAGMLGLALKDSDPELAKSIAGNAFKEADNE